jgi:hypothetical protein
MSDSRTYSIEVLHDIERELSEPLFRGVPIGPALGTACVIELHFGNGNWTFTERWKNLLRRLKYTLRPIARRAAMPAIPQGRLVVGWMYNFARINDLVQPVLKEFEPDRTIVLCGTPEMLAKVPNGMGAVSLDQIMQFDVAAWRADYRKCRGSWHERLRVLCRKHQLPHGAYDRLALHLLLSSQYVAGCLDFLRAVRPSKILVDFDRGPIGSCLVLSARPLGIPTFSLVHGVLNEHAVGYVPVLADRIFCWGEMQRRQFLAEGEPPEKLVVAGCPRLTRDLTVTRADARRKLGLAVEMPVVLFGTTMIGEQARLDMADLFCAALENIDDVSGVVRLHPADRLDVYTSVARRYPNVRFSANGDATLDEALAATDIVVVPNSGLGSDALVKRRLAIILDMPGQRLGHGADLIKQAGCPRVINATELAAEIESLLHDESKRQCHTSIAERYVHEFCAEFGENSARRIAETVRLDATANSVPMSHKP